MKTAPLKTKLHIPALRPNLITRTRLLDQLSSGLENKLTLVSAPAGFGKSTLVAMRACLPGPPLAWLSLDSRDNDPVVFLTYIFTAINAVGNIGDGSLAEIQSSQRPPSEAILEAWINELANYSGELVLVLDDYHVIESSDVHQQIEFLLEHMPPNFHLVIITRSDPNLRLARIRANGFLTEIREADLRFTRSEVSEFFKCVMGLQLSAENTSMLAQRTEGWVVGMQLAGLAMEGRSDVDQFVQAFSGGHHHILDYLIEEVFNRQPDDIQAFLLQTAVLERMCAPLCNVLTGKKDGRAILQSLDHLNLFVIPLDDEREWYRYHHMFADILRHKLEEERPNLVSDLHRRAGSWYAENNLIAEALHHMMAAQDYNSAADLIEPVTSSMIGLGKTETLKGWIEALPEPLLKQRPLLCVALAWIFNLHNEVDRIEPLLQDAERALEIDRFNEATDAEVRGQAATLRGYTALQLNDPQRALEHMAKAMTWLPVDDTYLRSIVAFTQGVVLKRGGVWEAAEKTLQAAEAYGRASGNLSIAIGARVHWVEMFIILGRLRQAAKDCAEAIEYYLPFTDGNRLPNLGFVYTKLGEILYEWNDLKGAEDNLTHGLELTGRMIAAWAWRRDGLVCLSRLKQAQGESELAQVHLDQAIDVNERMQDFYDKTDLSVEQARLWLAQGKVASTRQWTDRHKDTAETNDERITVMLFRVLLTEGDAHESSDVLTSVVESAEATGRMSLLLEALALQSLAHRAEGNTAKAVAVLLRALTLAEPEGFVRTFLEAGDGLSGLLRELASQAGGAPQGESPVPMDYISELLTAFPEVEAELASALPSDSPLNEREIQVLQLLSAGLKTPEIADELILSKNTIKWYVRQVYEKLGVHSKAEAIEQGHQIGVLK